MHKTNDIAGNEDAHASLLEEIRQHTKKRVAQMTVKPGQEISRYITGTIFILEGSAVLYRQVGEKRVFMDRMLPGRLFAENLLSHDDDGHYILLAESEGLIAVANLKDLQFANRTLSEKIANALFNELHQSCKVARDQICNLRTGSARARLIDGCRQILASSQNHPDEEWTKLDIKQELFLEISNVSGRQFTRLLPELHGDGLLKVIDSEIYVQENLVKAATSER